jgi:hypothetical protein
LWADLAPGIAGTLRTTTGAVLKAAAEGGLARAARAAPGFVAVSAMADDEETLGNVEHDLFVAMCEGVLSLASEPVGIVGPSARPYVARYVRVRAREAIERGAATAVLTSALHRSFRVPYAELLVVRELDGIAEVAVVRERVADAIAAAPADRVPAPLARGGAAAIAEHVDTVLDRFGRHGFLLDRSGDGDGECDEGGAGDDGADRAGDDGAGRAGDEGAR